jgi:two-component system cell cycle sensor histidine kinase/response regulator CckA
MQEINTKPARLGPDDREVHPQGDADSTPGTESHLLEHQSHPNGNGRRLGRILVVEDSATQAHRLRLILEAEGYEVEVAPDGEQGFVLLDAPPFDLVISDILMPGLSGYELCRKIKDDPGKRTVPVILLTSLTDPMDIIRGLECGADNFITKPYESSYLLGRVKTIFANKALRTDGRLKMGAEVVFLGKRLTINSDKEQILDLLISTFEETVRTNAELQASKGELAAAKCKVDEYARRLEGQLRSTDDRRKQAETALVDSERRFRRLIEFSPDAMFINRENKIVFVNPPCLKLFGASGPEQVLGKSVFDFIHPDYHAVVKERVRLMQMGEAVPLIEEKIVRLDGKLVDVEISASPFLEDGVTAIQVMCRDISERKKLEAQYRQAQKMEAVGQLAGGVAHDFNNLLTVISGYSEVLLGRLPAADPASGLLQEIHKAGERAAGLTRQLLAFNRRQIIQPQVLDLNALVSDMGKMLRRMIGEDVSLTTVLAPRLGLVKADPGQIEQVVMNLAVNARDAMPQGGKLTIETANVELDEGYTRTRPEVKSGSYALLAVSDTGCGMTEEVKAHIFEPFFTTKEPGKGTGLGLATAYGIIKQSGGYIYASSETGHGTTFKIYLPLVEDGVPSGKSRADLKTMPHGSETILLAEDEDAVRSLTRYTLQMQGYTVLESKDGEDAVRVAGKYEGRIDLLMTDVVMPRMGGRQVAERLSRMQPGIKVLFLSGYTDDAVVRYGVLEADVAFLQKPFTPSALAGKVREVLDQGRGSEACRRSRRQGLTGCGDILALPGWSGQQYSGETVEWPVDKPRPGKAES